MRYESDRNILWIVKLVFKGAHSFWNWYQVAFVFPITLSPYIYIYKFLWELASSSSSLITLVCLEDWVTSLIKGPGRLEKAHQSTNNKKENLWNSFERKDQIPATNTLDECHSTFYSFLKDISFNEWNLFLIQKKNHFSCSFSNLPVPAYPLDGATTNKLTD